MHRPGQQQRRDRDSAGPGGRPPDPPLWGDSRPPRPPWGAIPPVDIPGAVGQDDEAGAGLDRGRDLGADRREPGAQALAAAARVVAAVHHVGGEPGQVALVVDVHDLGQVVVADHRVGQHDLAAGGRHRLEQVLLRPGDRAERGDQLFPDRVERRVGHLGEQLGEVVEHQPRPVGKHRHRRVRAHRPDRLGTGPRHRGQDDPQFLLGVPVHPLQRHQLGPSIDPSRSGGYSTRNCRRISRSGRSSRWIRPACSQSS